MQINKFGLFILVLLSGFTGGFVSNMMFAHAQDFEQVITAKTIQLVNSTGKVIGTWTSCGEGSPCLNFYDSENRVRLQLGLYEAASENGMLFIGLFDDKSQMKQLMRIYGQAQAPAFIMKNNEQDKLIMGLDFQESTEPFLVTFDKDSAQHIQFGHYGGK